MNESQELMDAIIDINIRISMLVGTVSRIGNEKVPMLFHLRLGEIYNHMTSLKLMVKEDE